MAVLFTHSKYGHQNTLGSISAAASRLALDAVLFAVVDLQTLPTKCVAAEVEWMGKVAVSECGVTPTLGRSSLYALRICGVTVEILCHSNSRGGLETVRISYRLSAA